MKEECSANNITNVCHIRTWNVCKNTPSIWFDINFAWKIIKFTIAHLYRSNWRPPNRKTYFCGSIRIHHVLPWQSCISQSCCRLNSVNKYEIILGSSQNSTCVVYGTNKSKPMTVLSQIKQTQYWIRWNFKSDKHEVGNAPPAVQFSKIRILNVNVKKFWFCFGFCLFFCIGKPRFYCSFVIINRDWLSVLYTFMRIEG